MKILKTTILGIAALYTLFLYLSCGSAPKAASAKVTEETLSRAVAENPESADAHYNLGYYFYSKSNYAAAAESFEKVLELNRDYRVKEELHWTPANASVMGVKTSEPIYFSDFSLYYFLGSAYRGNPRSRAALEKALAALRRGYEIDITGGKNDNKDLKAGYLGTIAKVLDWLWEADAAKAEYNILTDDFNLVNSADDAKAAYSELAKVATVTDEIAARINGKIPAAYALPDSIKMGMTRAQIARATGGSTSATSKDNIYGLSVKGKPYLLEIHPQKGLTSCFFFVENIDFGRVVLVFTNAGGLPLSRGKKDVIFLLENPIQDVGIIRVTESEKSGIFITCLFNNSV